MSQPHDIKMCGSVTVWPKWQVVIPKEVREMLNIQPGDSLVVIVKAEKAVGMIKSENIPDMIDYIQWEMNKSST